MPIVVGWIILRDLDSHLGLKREVTGYIMITYRQPQAGSVVNLSEFRRFSAIEALRYRESSSVLRTAMRCGYHLS